MILPTISDFFYQYPLNLPLSTISPLCWNEMKEKAGVD